MKGNTLEPGKEKAIGRLRAFALCACAAVACAACSSGGGENAQEVIDAGLSYSGKIKGHGYVDLGLSVKWAVCNVGAEKPWEYGDYYAWGETETKEEYTEENSVTYGKNVGDIMGDIKGNPQYDVARKKWGGTWRLPTKAEQKELMDKCEWTWTSRGGGYKVTGPNGKSIFLPAAGRRYGSSLYRAGEGGYYWSSTPGEDDTDCAYVLSFDSGDFDWSWNYRCRGQSVRPVSE